MEYKICLLRDIMHIIVNVRFNKFRFFKSVQGKCDLQQKPLFLYIKVFKNNFIYLCNKQHTPETPCKTP